MLSKILQITLKDIRIRFSSPTQWLFFLILPLLFITIFGSSLSGGGTPGIGIEIVDQDQTAFSAELITLLSQSGSLIPEFVSEQTTTGLFEDRDTAAVLVIPAGFAEKLEAGVSAELELRIQPNNSNGLIVGQAVNNAAAELSRPFAIAQRMTDGYADTLGFADEVERADYFERARLDAETVISTMPAQIVLTGGGNSAETGFDLASQQVIGQLITWVFIPLLGTSVLFTEERTKGTLRRLLTTPTSKAVTLLGSIFSQTLLGLIQMGILVGFGMLVFDITFANNLSALLLLMTAFVLSGVALGTAMGTATKTEGQANNLSVMFGMLMALLGGCWFPYEFFSPAVKQVANLVPTSWALRGMLDLTQGAPMLDILPNAGVLLGFAALFFAVGVWRFRFE